MYEKSGVIHRFEKQLNAMIKRSTDFQDNFSKDEQIYKLLGRFIEFSYEYIKLLAQAPSEIFRYPFVVNKGIERLLQEWNVLSRASEQRLIKGFYDEIEKATAVAQRYCEKWNSISSVSSFHKLDAPVIYFEKMFRISRSIYAPEIPVISIPLTDYDQDENWQGLAHEFSHHIFWNGFGVDDVSAMHQKIRERISNNLQPNRAILWRNWLEEVFADVYGTLLAGSEYAFSAQDRIGEQISRKEDLTIADHQHPCNYLRPLITAQALSEIVSQVGGDSAIPGALKERWLDFSKQAARLRYKSVPLGLLEEDIDFVVGTMLHGEMWPVKLDPIKLLAEPVKPTKRLMPLTPIVAEGPHTLAVPSLKDFDLPNIFMGLKQFFMFNSNQIVQGLKSAPPEQTEKDTELTAWSLLLGLELSESGGYHVHGCAPRTDHYHSFFIDYWWPGHTHGEAGTELKQCTPT